MECNTRRANKTNNVVQDNNLCPKPIPVKIFKPFFDLILRTILPITLLMFFCKPAFCITKHKMLITINKFVEHPALNAVEQGITKTLQDRELISNKVLLKLDNAYGNITNSVQIAKHHAAMKPSFMIAIATPSAQANFKAKPEDTMLAFVAVTDPAAAGIMVSGTRIIGVTDQPPIAELIEKTIRIVPKVKIIGLIFNPGEINSVQIVEQLEQIAMNKNIQVKKVPITSSSNVTIAMQKLVQDVDVIYLPQDNTVVSSIDNIIQISLRAKIPVIANDPSLVDRGVLLGIGADYFSMGCQLGNMIAALIEGNKIAHTIQNSLIQEVKINTQSAAKLGITILDKEVRK